MKIDITPILDEKGLKIEYRGKESLRLEEANFQGPLDLDLVLIGTGKGVFVQGTITGVTILFLRELSHRFFFSDSHDHRGGVPAARQHASHR